MDSPAKRPPSTPLGEWWKLIAMGTVLAGMIFLAFFYDYAAGTPAGSGPPVQTIRVQTPELDLGTLTLARDGTRDERLVIEARPLAHLLEQSIDIVPSIARALEMPDKPVPLAELRANPAQFRGRYLWYRGKLEYLSPGKSGHPIDRYRIHEGWIRTEDDQHIAFRVSIEPRDVQVGDYVRIEGFFMKLHDSHDLPRADLMPVLVGPELFRDFPPWDEVERLNPAVFDDIDDELLRDGVALEEGGATLTLPESQYHPLWHLASYARTHTPSLSFGEWRAIRPFVSKAQLDDMRLGKTEHGTPFRILGAFIQGHTWEARPNPLGIDSWSEAWVQIQDLGGKIVPVWIPGPIDSRRNASLEIKAYYFRRMLYHTRDGWRFTPVFVADALHPFDPPEAGLGTQVTKWTFVAVVLALVAGLVWLGLRDRRRHAAHLTEMDQRRKRRRAARAAGAAGE